MNGIDYDKVGLNQSEKMTTSSGVDEAQIKKEMDGET